jgi:hypothetical protein
MSYQVNFRVKIRVSCKADADRVEMATREFQIALENISKDHLEDEFELKVSPAEIVFL